MSFLNATLLAGLGAAAIPIVLHLMTRKEPKRVVFPAVRFLTERFESNRSRLRVRRWWLLLLRVLAFAVIAMALANPVIHHSVSMRWLTIGIVALLGFALLVMASVAFVRMGSSPVSLGLVSGAAIALLAAILWGGYTAASGPSVDPDVTAPVAMAIVLDNGPTSAWETADDDRIARMKDTASWMIAKLPTTSRIAVIDRSSVPATFSLDAAGALSKVESLETIQAPQPVVGRVDAAIRLLRTSELESRQVLVLSNLAQSSWSEQSLGDGVKTSLAEGEPVAVTVFDLGEFDGTNRGLTLQQITDKTPARGTPVPVVTTVRLSAGETTDPVSVTVELQRYESSPGLPVVRNGVTQRPPLRRVDRKSLKLVPGAASEVVLTMPPLETGSHHGLVRLNGEDAFTLDDERYFTLDVLPASPILLVADNLDDAKVFSAAITAPFAVDDPNAEFAIERIAYTDLPAVQPDNFEATILLDPPADVLRDVALADFVRGGGRLMVCLGPSAGESEVRPGFLPTLVRRWRVPQPGTFLEVVRSEHPLFEPFVDTPRWSDYPIFQYWQLRASDTDQVLTRFAGTGHPAIVQRQLGEGAVLVVATPLPAVAEETRDWNDLFGAEAWPAFLLVRQATEWLSERATNAPATVVGRPHVVEITPANPQDQRPRGGPTGPEATQSIEQQADDTTTQRLQLFPPGDSPPVPIEADAGTDRVAVTTVPRAGTYWLRGVSVREGFSANLPEDATQLARIDPAQLDLMFGPEGYELAKTREEIELLENQNAASVSLQSPALLLALIIFLLEQILGNRFYRGRAPGPSPAGAVAA